MGDPSGFLNPKGSGQNFQYFPHFKRLHDVVLALALFKVYEGNVVLVNEIRRI
jgi:hypothetical protein